LKGLGARQGDSPAAKPVPLTSLFAVVGALGNLPLAAAPLVMSTTRDEFGLTGVAAGLPATVFLLACAAGGMLAAPLVRLTRPRASGLVGFIAFGAANILALATDDLHVLTCALAVAGLFAGIAAAASARLIAQAPKPEALAAGIGVLTGIMLVVFGAASAWAAETWGRAGLHGALLLAAGLLAPLTFRLPRSNPVAPDRPQASPAVGDLLPALVLLGVFIYAAKDGAAWSLAQVRADDLGMSAPAKSALLAGAGALGIAGAALAAWCSRGGDWFLPALAGLGFNAALGSCQFMTQSPEIFTLLQWTYTGSHLFIVPFILGLAAQIDSQGRLVAAAGATLTLGAAAGPVLGALLYDAAGPSFLAAVLFSLIVSAALLWAFPALSRRKLEREEA
jgi:predicted MFS family arabinose efflux permease